MADRFILTPYYMDRLLPGLEPLLREGWKTNRIDLPGGTAPQRMAAVYQPLAQFVTETLARGDRPVSIAGDCPACIGMTAGLQRAGLDPILVWLDAHGDFNTWETTPSGFLGGMPLAMLVGRGEQTILKALGVRPLEESRVFLADARDLDPLERVALEGSAVHHVKDVRTLPQVLPAGQALHVHFDTDILCPEDAPAMNYLAAGGPTMAELREVFAALRAGWEIAAVSLSSWNPALDPEGRTRANCMELLEVLLEG